MKDFYKNIAMNQEEFEEYSNEMRRFRNRYVAHAGNYNRVIPYLDKAIDAVISLDEMLENKDEEIPFGTLKDYYEAWKVTNMMRFLMSF